jgi:hypothetical protein
MASTAGTIISYGRNLLKTESTSNVPVIGDTFMLAALSQANLEWARAHRRGGGVEPLIFMREGGVDLPSDTALAEDVATTDVSFDLDDASDQASSGAIVIWDDDMPDIAAYTSKATNTLSGVTGLAFAHEDGDVVSKLYALPTNFKTFRPAENYGDGVQLNGIALRYMQGPPTVGYFSMYDDETTKYLWLPKGSTGSAAYLYEKTSTVLDDISDTVDVPQEYEFFLVWRLVEHGFLGRGDDAQKALYAKQKADQILADALKEQNIGQYVRVRRFGRYGIQRDPSLFQRVPR